MGKSLSAFSFFAVMRKFCLAAVLFFVLSSSAWAAFKPRVGAAGASVIINGIPAVKFRAGNGSLTPAKKAEITAGRIKELVTAGIDPKAFYAKGDKTQGKIFVGETMICIATAADAGANKIDALSLAVSWASQIKSLLMMPAVAISAKQLTIPLGEIRRVAVGGAAMGDITVKSYDGTIAKINVDNQSRIVEVNGCQVGASVLEISVEGEVATLPVSVKKYAGRLDSKPVAEVTGNPCPSSLLCYAAKQALTRSVVCEPGARVEFGDVDCQGGSLPAASARTVKTQLRISGPGYIPYLANAQVTVRNIPMPRAEASQIFYSNDPERLLKYQVLFAGKLEQSKPTRVLFHHQNAMGKSAHFIVDIINPSITPVKVKISRAVSQPLVDTLVVGYKASLAFLKDDLADVATIETIPPESRLVVVSDMLGHLDTTSGILQITQVDAGQAYVRIADYPPGLDDVAAGDIAAAPNPLVLTMSDHVYPTPVKKITADYEVGKRWAFIPIGKAAISDASSQKLLLGNYGVTYNIDVKVANPTNTTKKVTVAFDPSAGLASGVFNIDGEFVSTKYVKPPDEFSLKTYQLRPGEERHVRIVTVPVAGSNYPATLIVRS